MGEFSKTPGEDEQGIEGLCQEGARGGARGSGSTELCSWGRNSYRGCGGERIRRCASLPIAKESRGVCRTGAGIPGDWRKKKAVTDHQRRLPAAALGSGR